MIHRSICALAAFAFAGSVGAGQAEICYSAAVPFASAVPPTNATVFVCPIAGSQTLPQLAALGWEVVQLGPLVVGGTNQTDQLVIQKK